MPKYRPQQFNLRTAIAAMMSIAAVGAGQFYVSSATAQTAPVAPQKEAGVVAAIDKVLAGAHRSDINRARDVYRHPKETLAFFLFLLWIVLTDPSFSKSKMRKGSF